MYGKTKRKSFARYQEILDMPNLLEVQKNSYQWFLDTGLREVFRDVEAITDYAGNLELSFIDYSMDEKPKYSEEECKARRGSQDRRGDHRDVRRGRAHPGHHGEGPLQDL